jgi:hypothetical protein
MNESPVRRFVATHRLTAAIGLAILVALLLTAVSISLYIRSGASRLDLSRPGYEGVREQVNTTNDDDTFSATGPMNAEVVDQFQTLYTKKRTAVEKLDPFSPTVLSDDSLRLLDAAPAQ